MMKKIQFRYYVYSICIGKSSNIQFANYVVSETEKKKWTEHEKAALKPLVLKAYREKKPPNKSDITELLKNSRINGIPWLNVKYQVWAMAQQKIRQAKIV